MQLETIIGLNAQKHVQIYLLSKQGYSNKDIANHLSTNVGHVYNVLKSYKENPEKAKTAEGLLPEVKAPVLSKPVIEKE